MALLRVSDRLPNRRPWKPDLKLIATSSGLPGLALFMTDDICASAERQPCCW